MIMRKPLVRLKERGDCHLGEIVMPMAGGNIRVQTLGWDPLSAVRRAAATALQVATDPAIAPFLPPQVAIAAQAVRTLSKLSPEGLRAAAREGAPSTRKLARALLRKMDKEIEKAEAEDAGVSGPFSVITSVFGGKKRGKRSAPRGGTRVRDNRGGGTATQGPRSLPTPPPPPPPQYDQYGNPIAYDQYGNPLPPMPPGYPAAPGVNPLDPNDYAAMQAWGPQAFDQPSELQPETQADEYFEAYEDRHYSDDADIVPDEGEE